MALATRELRIRGSYDPEEHPGPSVQWERMTSRSSPSTERNAWCGRGRASCPSGSQAPVPKANDILSQRKLGPRLFSSESYSIHVPKRNWESEAQVPEAGNLTSLNDPYD